MNFIKIPKIDFDTLKIQIVSRMEGWAIQMVLGLILVLLSVVALISPSLPFPFFKSPLWGQILVVLIAFVLVVLFAGMPLFLKWRHKFLEEVLRTMEDTTSELKAKCLETESELNVSRYSSSILQNLFQGIESFSKSSLIESHQEILEEKHEDGLVSRTIVDINGLTIKLFCNREKFPLAQKLRTRLLERQEFENSEEKFKVSLVWVRKAG